MEDWIYDGGTISLLINPRNEYGFCAVKDIFFFYVLYSVFLFLSGFSFIQLYCDSTKLVLDALL